MFVKRQIVKHVGYSQNEPAINVIEIECLINQRTVSPNHNHVTIYLYVHDQVSCLFHLSQVHVI